jgi:ribosomal protein S4
MNKFYKQKLYKKYRDEIWGKLVVGSKFSYNKKSLLLHYRDTVLKRRLRIRTKFSYFRRGFLKHLNYSLFSFVNFRKRLNLLNFSMKKKFARSSSSNLFVITSVRRKWTKKGYLKIMRTKRFKKVKILSFLRFNICLFSSFASNNFFKSNVNLLSTYKTLVFSKKYVLSNFPKLFINKKFVYLKSKNFLRLNNLQFTLKKKLNLRKQKTFFYSVHIAAPRKKNKKWSLFGSKNIYYKKVSLFFGFKKASQFLKLYRAVVSVWGRNESDFFLTLEGRLETFLLRLNFFPSIYFIKRFILSGNVFVDNKIISYPSHFLKYNQIVSVNKRYFKLVYSYLKSNLKSRRVLLNNPPFIEVDYKLFVATLIKNPELSSLTMPASFNLYTKFPTFHR